MKIKESFLCGLTQRALFNLIADDHKSILAVNTTHNKKGLTIKPRDISLVICNPEIDFIVPRGTNGQYNLQIVLPKHCFLGADLIRMEHL